MRCKVTCGRMKIEPTVNFINVDINFIGISKSFFKKRQMGIGFWKESLKGGPMLKRLKDVKLNFRTIVIVTAVPLVLAALFVIPAGLSGLPFLRFDAGYFTAEYAEQYDAPADVVAGLEEALRSGDRAAYGELSGLRVAPIFPQSDNVRMVTLLDKNEAYYSYLFWDATTLDRFEYNIEQINGRWVVSPTDLSFYLRTGRWLRTWTPIAAGWWIIEFTLLIIVGLNALMKRWKNEFYAV